MYFTIQRRPDWKIALLLTLFLAIAQLGYTLHQLHHALELITHTTDNDEACEHGDGQHHGHDVCLLCIAYAAISGGIPSLAFLTFSECTEPPFYVLPPEVTYRPPHASCYSSRAPPVVPLFDKKC